MLVKIFQARSYRSSHWLSSVAGTLLRFRFLREGNSKLSILIRLVYVSNFEFGCCPNQNEQYPPIEILFVSTAKDLEILPAAIEHALKATLHHDEVKVIVIVPKPDFLMVSSTLSHLRNVEVIQESDQIEDDYIQLLKSKFGWRSGWVLQQLLKVTWVFNSTAPGVLIVDSDTLLLCPRVWFNGMGRQLLTPTWEYHLPYFDFLNRIAGLPKRPKSSFVPHHMLMQPKFLREAINLSSVNDLRGLKNRIMDDEFGSEVSPFCIEYEFYAQHMMSNHPELIQLRRWSNTGFSRSGLDSLEKIQAIADEQSESFASISFHSYLK